MTNLKENVSTTEKVEEINITNEKIQGETKMNNQKTKEITLGIDNNTVLTEMEDLDAKEEAKLGYAWMKCKTDGEAKKKAVLYLDSIAEIVSSIKENCSIGLTYYKNEIGCRNELFDYSRVIEADFVDLINSSPNPYLDYFNGKFAIYPVLSSYTSLPMDSTFSQILWDKINAVKNINSADIGKNIKNVMTFERLASYNKELKDDFKNSKLVLLHFLFDIQCKKNGDLSKKSKFAVLVEFLENPLNEKPKFNRYILKFNLIKLLKGTKTSPKITVDKHSLEEIIESVEYNKGFWKFVNDQFNEFKEAQKQKNQENTNSLNPDSQVADGV